MCTYLIELVTFALTNRFFILFNYTLSSLSDPLVEGVKSIKFYNFTSLSLNFWWKDIFVY